MNKRVTSKILVVFFCFLVIIFFYKKLNNNIKIDKVNINEQEENSSNSNIIKDVNYVSKDSRGNEYIIDASEGQIDLSDNKTIFLTNVRAVINLKNSNKINITSDFGKYNIDNFDTIFSKNVIITYIDNKIEGDYLDFSLNRNSMVISRNVIYSNAENVLKADVIEVDIKTKDTKIFMYELNEKVNIKTKS